MLAGVRVLRPYLWRPRLPGAVETNMGRPRPPHIFCTTPVLYNMAVHIGSLCEPRPRFPTGSTAEDNARTTRVLPHLPLAQTQPPAQRLSQSHPPIGPSMSP